VNITSRLSSLIVLASCILWGCGGGADIGNPGNIASFSISGCVKKSPAEGAGDARVILGRSRDISVDGNSKDTIVKDGFTYIVNRRSFDTVICDAYGHFSFDDLSVGEYVLLADLQQKRGIVKVSTVLGNVDATIMIDNPVDITIKPYAVPDTSQPYFTGSRIAGTPLVAKADSAGVILFRSVPSGLLDVLLYKSNNTTETFKDLRVSLASGAVLMVDPKRSTSYWTVKTKDRESSDRPYILSYGIWNDSLPTEGTTEYDLYIQFSQPMEVIPTENALHILSSDSTIQVDESSWQGTGLIYLRLCARDSTGVCNRDRLSGISSWTVTVDTLATSSFGYQMAWPEVLEVKR
jgi:hypothetical protein